MKQIKYKFNKLAFLISVKIEFLKVRFFYLVNKNKASFKYMNKMIKFVKTSVEKKTGIVLEKEIKILK